MMYGNHVHTSTAILRRSRLRETGLFDEDLLKSGEDYEFHLRTCYQGPVALLDASSTFYRVGAQDQLTQPVYSLYMARNNLKTIETWLQRGKDRLRVPPSKMRTRLAGSHAWVGETAMLSGHRGEAITHLWRSVALRPDARVARLAFASLLPAGIQDGMRRRWHDVKGRLHS